MHQQRKLPSKRYSSYMPVTELSTLEDHVSALPPSTSRSENDVVNMRKHSANTSDKFTRRKSLNTLHFDALQNAVSKLSRIDDFDLEELGYGFFSDVFKVTHKQSGKVMVLKRNKDTNTKLNILREVQLMNRLSHPNILKFFGVCVHEGQLHALTEFINGGDLDQLVQQRNTVYLSWSVRIQLALDIAQGLQYLHSMGIFHRDVTAKNCLIRTTTTNRQKKKYSAVVADLGLAEKIPSTQEQKEKLRTVGTPYCMAPEVLTSKPYDEKSDFFSFGIIICQLIIRTTSDPEKLPRSNDFGVNRDVFCKLVLNGLGAPEQATGKLPLSMPPESFLQLGYDCSEVDPAKRPFLKDIVSHLERMLNEEKQRAKLKKSTVQDSSKGNDAAVLGDISVCAAKLAIDGKSQMPYSVSSEDNKENKLPAKSSPPMSASPRRPSCSRLSRSSSDVSNELISHAASIIASSQKTFSSLGEEETDMLSVVNSLNEAFINPFSSLEKIELQERKLHDRPSSEVLEMTFDLPALKLSSGSPKRTRNRHVKTRRARQDRPKSLLLNLNPTEYTNTTTASSHSPKILTPEPQRDIPKLSKLCEGSNIDSDCDGSLPFVPGQHTILEDSISEQQRWKNALIRSVAFCPQGRSLLSWWNNHQRITDWRSVASVLSIMTDKMGTLKRSISLPDMTRDAGPLLAFSRKTPSDSNSPRSSASSQNGPSLNGKPPAGSKLHPNAYPAYVTLPRKKKSRCTPSSGDRSRKMRSKTSDDVFVDENALEIVHEETSDVKYKATSSTNTKHCTSLKPPISPRREINNNTKCIPKARPGKPYLHDNVLRQTQEGKEDFYSHEDHSSYPIDGNVSSSSTSSGTSTSSGFKILLQSGVVSSTRRQKAGSHPPSVAESETVVSGCDSDHLPEPCLPSVVPDNPSSPNMNPASKDSCRAPRSNRDSGYNEEVFSNENSSDSQSSLETVTTPSAPFMTQSSNQTRLADYLNEIAPRCKINECDNSNIGKLVGKSH